MPSGGSARRCTNLSVCRSLYNPRVWALALVYFGLVACNYGVGFWLPQIIKAFGLSNAATGWVTAIPYAVGAAFMVWYGYHSDRRGERKVAHRGRAVDRGGGIAGSTLTGNPTLTMIAFAVGACGVFGDAAGVLDLADRRACPAPQPPPASR